MDNLATTGKIVWDIGKANGETYSSTAKYVTGLAGEPNNVIMWTPLPGTDPADRETLHIFTLRVNNSVGVLTNEDGSARLDQWVSLFQNGTQLEMSAVQSTTLCTIYEQASPSGATYVSNALFTQIRKSGSGPFTLSGGVPAANAYASTSGARWAFCENSFREAHGEDVAGLARSLRSKWGIS